MEASQTARLNIPTQDLAEFTLFPPNAAAAVGWAQALPVANTAGAIELLDKALDELNRFSLSVRVPRVTFQRPWMHRLMSPLPGAVSGEGPT